MTEPSPGENTPLTEPSPGENTPLTEPSPGENTRAVHSPATQPPAQRPFGLPVYRTAVFGFDTAEEYAEVLGGLRPGYVYSRVDNPTADAFAAALAALEGVGADVELAGQPFASGMAAISTVLLALCSAGSEVVIQRQVYGGTVGLLANVLSRFGVRARFVEGVEEAARAISPSTALVWAETIANPTLSVADLPALAEVAHRAEVPLVVDSTFASPAVCRPVRFGADLVVHSATKYIGGHSDVTGGAVVGSAPLIARIRAARIDLGGALAPDEAWLLHRGLATLPLRVARHCSNAATVAEELAAHPALELVYYPGLPGHPDHDLAVMQPLGTGAERHQPGWHAHGGEPCGLDHSPPARRRGATGCRHLPRPGADLGRLGGSTRPTRRSAPGPSWLKSVETRQTASRVTHHITPLPSQAPLLAREPLESTRSTEGGLRCFARVPCRRWRWRWRRRSCWRRWRAPPARRIRSCPVRRR
ncbi:MAG: trans-sulfuration enzyme family protein [Mycobacteriales bacterium]